MQIHATSYARKYVTGRILIFLWKYNISALCIYIYIYISHAINFSFWVISEENCLNNLKIKSANKNKILYSSNFIFAFLLYIWSRQNLSGEWMTDKRASDTQQVALLTRWRTQRLLFINFAFVFTQPSRASPEVRPLSVCPLATADLLSRVRRAPDACAYACAPRPSTGSEA